MKSMYLMTPDLHDFSDLGIRLPRRVSVLCAVAACAALLYAVFRPSAAEKPADQAAPPAIASPAGDFA